MIKAILVSVLFFSVILNASPKDADSMDHVPADTVITFNNDFIIPANQRFTSLGTVKSYLSSQFIVTCYFEADPSVKERLINAGESFVVTKAYYATNSQAVLVLAQKAAYITCYYEIQSTITIWDLTETLKKSSVSIKYPKPEPF